MSGVYSRAGVSSLFGGSPVIQLVALSLRDRKRDRRQDVTDRSRNPAREGRSLDPLVRTRSLKQRDGGRVHSRSRPDQGVRTTATTSVGYVNCGMVGTAHPTSATSAQFRQSNWLVRATAGVPRHTPTRPWVEHGRERTALPDPPLPQRSPHRRSPNTSRGNDRLAHRQQSQTTRCRWAIPNRRCPLEIEVPLPQILSLTKHECAVRSKCVG